jgi:hypothetical protein
MRVLGTGEMGRLKRIHMVTIVCSPQTAEPQAPENQACGGEFNDTVVDGSLTCRTARD